MGFLRDDYIVWYSPLRVRVSVGTPDKYRGLFSLARRRHRILARPNDKSGMTLKPCTSAQLQRDLKIGNILDTTKSSSASCVFIIRLLK